MTAEITNLRKARKAKKRLTDEARAEENRAKFGRSKAERKASEVERDLAKRRLDGVRREPDSDERGE